MSSRWGWRLCLAVLGTVGFAAACGGDGAAPVSVTTASPVATATASRGTIRIAAVGDVMLARTVGDAMVARGIDAPLAEVRDRLRAADLAFANLEVALTDRGSPERKDFTFRAPSSYAGALSSAGIDVVSVANNHTLDYGPTGLADTLAALASAGVKAAGAGDDLNAALQPATLDVAGLRLAVLAFAAFDDDSVTGFRARTFAAEPSKPGVAWATPSAVQEAVRRAAVTHDIVIVSMHWGHEYRDDIADEQRQLAYVAIDAGAQLVLGSGPHVLQGWERRGTGLIIYSLGNFVFDLDQYDRAQPGLPSILTLVFEAEIGRQGVVSAGYAPVRIDERTGFPVPASGEAAAAVRERLARLRPSVADAVASSLGGGR